jgi:glycosyltransferase involved in cell wall biosynthesis
MRVGLATVAPSPHLAGTILALQQVPGVSVETRCLQRSLPNRGWDQWTKGVIWEALAAEGGSRGLVSRSDIVVAATSYFRRETWYLVRAARRMGVASVALWEAPSSFSPSLVRLTRYPLVRLLMQAIDGLVGITEETVDVYRTQYHFNGPATWCPYHRDISPFLSSEPERPRESLRFVTLGSLVPRKGLDVAIRALSLIGREATLTIAGDGPERSSLSALAERVALGRVRFMGSVPFEATREVLRKAHALVLPSRHDGFGMAALEALATGLPVLASLGVFSARQYIREGVNGWLVPVGDVTALAHRMAELVRRREEWPQFSAAARASLKDYNAQRDAERFAAFLRELYVSRSREY